MSSAPRLLLVEDERHVADLLARRSGERQDRWIALGPSAMNALERQGLRYAIPEDYHRWSELAELCAELHRRVQRLCSELDRALLERAPELAERSIAPFQFHIFPLIMMFDSLAARTLQLRRVLAAHPGATPAIHVRPPQAPTDPELLFSSQETLWGRVLALITGGREADLLADPGPARRASARNLARRLVGSSVTLTTLAMSLRQGGVPRALLGRGESVLLVQGGPEWAAALAAIRRTGLRPLFALEARFAPPLRLAGRDEALDSLIASQLGSLFVVEGVSLYPLLAERLAAIWRQSATAAAMIARRIGAVRRRHRVRAVLRGSVSAGTGHMLNQLARGSGLPVLTWQHGMVTNRGEISQFRQFTDMMTANLVLAFGEESARAYERGRARWPQVSVARVGSATLDAIGERPRACRPPSGTVRVVYATTNYYRNDWYLGFAPGLSDRWLYRDQRTIAAALTEWSAAGRCEVRIKLHPDGDPPWAQGVRESRSLQVARARPTFAELLAWCDAVLLDFPSTTLLQALAAGRPTFVLLRFWRPSPDAQALLGRAAVARETAAELCEELRAYLQTRSFPADPDDSAFLRMCGTHADGGGAAARSAAELLGVLRTAPRAPACV